MYIESRSLAVSGPQHMNGQFADDADAANASPPDALRPLPDLPCKAVVAFSGASGPSRALARQFDRNVPRGAYHDRASIGVDAAYYRFQNQNPQAWALPRLFGFRNR